jgi:hypothetical protein
MVRYCDLDDVDWQTLKVSTRDDNVQQSAHVVRQQGCVTIHVKGSQKFVQLTSRRVFDATQSNVQIAGDKDIMRKVTRLVKTLINSTKKSCDTATDPGR